MARIVFLGGKAIMFFFFLRVVWNFWNFSLAAQPSASCHWVPKRQHLHVSSQRGAAGVAGHVCQDPGSTSKGFSWEARSHNKGQTFAVQNTWTTRTLGFQMKGTWPFRGFACICLGSFFDSGTGQDRLSVNLPPPRRQGETSAAWTARPRVSLPEVAKFGHWRRFLARTPVLRRSEKILIVDGFLEANDVK